MRISLTNKACTPWKLEIDFDQRLDPSNNPIGGSIRERFTSTVVLAGPDRQRASTWRGPGRGPSRCPHIGGRQHCGIVDAIAGQNRAFSGPSQPSLAAVEGGASGDGKREATQRRGRPPKPWAASDRLTISTVKSRKAVISLSLVQS